MNCICWIVILFCPYFCTSYNLDFNTFINGEKSFFVPDLERTWAEATAWCQEIPGRHLVSIESESEVDAILKAVGKSVHKNSDYWTSGERSGSKFIWWKRSVFEYTNWQSGEPDNFLDDQDCVVMKSNGQWADESCMKKNPFICESHKIKKTEICKCRDKSYDGVLCGKFSTQMESVFSQIFKTIADVQDVMEAQSECVFESPACELPSFPPLPTLPTFPPFPTFPPLPTFPPFPALPPFPTPTAIFDLLFGNMSSFKNQLDAALMTATMSTSLEKHTTSTITEKPTTTTTTTTEQPTTTTTTTEMPTTTTTTTTEQPTTTTTTTEKPTTTTTTTTEQPTTTTTTTEKPTTTTTTTEKPTTTITTTTEKPTTTTTTTEKPTTTTTTTEKPTTTTTTTEKPTTTTTTTTEQPTTTTTTTEKPTTTTTTTTEQPTTTTTTTEKPTTTTTTTEKPTTTTTTTEMPTTTTTTTTEKPTTTTTTTETTTEAEDSELKVKEEFEVYYN